MNIIKHSLVAFVLLVGGQLFAEKLAQQVHLEERTSTAAKSTSDLPEIYLIGDSIRIGYCKDVRRELDGKAEVKWPEGNCANSQNVLINLGWWRKFASSPAVIQFNCGHWDASHWDGDAEAITSLEEYGKNIRLIIRRLRRYYPKATLVYATTTPMNPADHTAGKRTTEQIREYNAVGVAIAKAEGIAVNDLFAWVEKWPASDWEDYCHFKPGANARLGKMIAESLMARVTRAEEKDFDLVIYGSTPAALSAAVQAKRMGKSTVIVSPETRIGGLTTGGLGQTDIGNKAAFGGIALEFYRDVAKWYSDETHWTHQKRSEYLPDGQCFGTKGEDSMWTFEPSAALAILEGWEKRDGLDIRRGKRLDRSKGKVKVDEVKVEGLGLQRRIVSFVTEDGTEYRGKMFVDATYEGDLLAAAGVSYTVGREANAQYGETLSGCQRVQAVCHQIEKGVSGYVRPGDPSSGYLPGVEKDDGRPDGEGDRFVQAYCFRMCLTDDPENRIPFAKPENYDERNYELLFRHMAAKPKDAFDGDLAWKLPWINSKMPNRKTDTNNRDGFSSDFIGQNWAWPEASYAERERILRAHLDYQRGLMWTLANHPRIPEAVRSVYSQWGTCRDEFKDGLGDGWQSQLYVREARRMVGEYVMTEHNCRGKVVVPRPVAMGAYGMDSHHVRRMADAQGNVYNEGDVEVHCDPAGNRYPPYPIDYGAILPKRGECANLLVPVCVSASHIAFGSIRMEPVFFALGQVAGTAAALAVDRSIAVQDVPYAALRAKLLAAGQVLEMPLYKAEGVIGTGAGWRLVREEKGKVVYIPFEGYYESKGGRIESEKFDLRGARFARLTFSAKAVEPGFWWVDLFGEDGKALPDVNSRIYASDDWRKYEEMIPISELARQGQLAFVSEKGIEVRDIKLEGVSAKTAAAWCDRLYATLPQVEVGDLSAVWAKLPRSRERILSGKPLRVVLLGDSIVNDTYCGNVTALVQREFPNVEFILSVRGSTGCWYYRDPKHFEQYVLAHKPDLVLVGGISNGKDEADFSTAEEDMIAVLELAKKSGIEVAVMSPPPSYEWRKSPEDTTWDENFVHARYEAWAKKVKHWQPLRRDYQRAATEKTGVAYWDLTTAPCEAIAKSGKPLNWFHRDTCHNDDRGKQLIAQVFAANFRVLIKTR